MTLKTCLWLLLLLAAATAPAATPTADDLIGRWAVTGLSESIDAAPEAAPPEVFTFRTDGTVHSALSDGADAWRLEDGGIVVTSAAGSQRLEIVDYGGDRMKWTLAVGDLLIVYHLERMPEE
jgi:hypothetical protein